MTIEETRKHLIEELKDFPVLLDSHDLVKIGLYPSIDACYLARKRGHSPSFIKLKRKVIFSKTAVIDFLMGRTTERE